MTADEVVEGMRSGKDVTSALAALILLEATAIGAAWGVDNDSLLSVARPAAPAKKPATATAIPAQPAPRSTVSQPAATPGKATPAQTAVPGAAAAAAPELGQMPGEPAATPAGPNPYLMQAGAALTANPSAATFAEFMRILKAMLAQPGMTKASADAIIKANPILQQLGVKVVSAGAGRVWTFPRISYTREVIVQWADTKTNVTYTGRRRIRQVTHTTTPRIQSLILPASVALKDAHVIAGEQGAQYLVLVGDEGGTQLWLHAFKHVNGGWVDSPNHFDSIPSFLTTNTSGRVSFRGSDLIFNVGRVVPAAGTQATSLPEAESSTYRFLLKLTESGYVLQRHVPDLAQFGTVRAFLEAIANNRTDIARSYLADTKLLSIPKYVGIKGPSSTFRVVQMASPPSGAPRYRIITGQRNDLIFEVAKMKDRPIVRAIFIAPPDPFLHELARILPTYDQLVPPPATPADMTAADAKRAQ
jgi:hypothetical protein